MGIAEETETETDIDQVDAVAVEWRHRVTNIVSLSSYSSHSYTINLARRPTPSDTCTRLQTRDQTLRSYLALLLTRPESPPGRRPPFVRLDLGFRPVQDL